MVQRYNFFGRQKNITSQFMRSCGSVWAATEKSGCAKIRLFLKDCPSWHENLLSFNFLSLSFIHYSKYFRIFALS